MAQYKIGTVAVTNGSSTVTAVDPSPGNPDPADDVLAATEWLTEISPGDLFYVNDTDVAYEVLSVSSDTALNLTGAYQGETVAASGSPTQSGAYYAIHRNFSAFYNMPLFSQGDIGLPVFIRLALMIIDSEMKIIDNRVTALEP